MRLQGFATLACMLAAAASASAQDGSFRLHPLSSAEDGVAFAIERGCLPFLVEGGSINERVHRSARGGELNGRRADRLYGRGDVQIQEDQRGGCYIVARRADAIQLRRSVLDALTRAGAPPTALQDSGPGSRDSNGKFRQEMGCFMISGKTGAYVMSTSTDGSHAALQLSVMIDSDGRCAQIVAAGQSLGGFVEQRSAQRANDRVERFRAIVGACRAIIGGAPVEEASRAADVRLGPPGAIPNAQRYAETGSASFFAGDPGVRASQVRRGEQPIWLFASQSGARCHVASGGTAALVEAMARTIAEGDLTASGPNEFRTPRGDTIRIQTSPQPEGLALFLVFMTRAAEATR